MPESSSDRDPVEKLAEEFLARQRRGESPVITEYVQKNPDLAEEIRELFPALVMMEKLKPADPTGDFTPESLPAESRLLEKLGDFRILREVGRGGMGVVYEAEQVSLGRHVALKVLPGHSLLNPRHLQRFQREAKSAARLHHTNIVPVYGVGEHNGVHYYVMQFIRGQGLDQVLDELTRLRAPQKRAEPPSENLSYATKALLTGQFTEDSAKRPENGRGNSSAKQTDSTSTTIHLPGQSSPSLSDTSWAYWQSIARVGLQVADALAYASSQGILHRDIKPSNLLLDEQGTVWVTDFGLAKAADDQENITNTNDIVGTIRYMAPERFNGQGDLRADLYSLGLTLYEFATFRPAFDENERNRLINQVLHGEHSAPRKLNKSIPRDLETIILKLVAREPEHRYQKAQELADDLRRFLEDKPVRARRIGSLERLGRWCKRNPVVAGLTGAVTILLLVVTVMALLSAQRDRSVAKTDRELRIKAEEAKRGEAEARSSTETALTALMIQNGLVSGKRSEFGDATLWFANAAMRSEADIEQKNANRVRALSHSRHTYQPVAAFEQPNCLVSSLAFHKDGRHLAIRSFHETKRSWIATVWEVGTETLFQVPTITDATCVAWSEDGQWLAIGTPKGEAVVCTFPGKEIVDRFSMGNQPINALEFSRDSKRLAIAADRSVQLRAFGRHQFDGTAMLHAKPIHRMAFSPNGDRLATACVDRSARVFPVPSADGKPIFGSFVSALNQNPIESIVAPTFNDDGTELLAINPVSGLVYYDARDGRVLRNADLPKEIYSFSVSKQGEHVAVGSLSAQILLTADGRPTSPLLLHKPLQRITAAAFSPDGKSLFTASSDRTLKRWSVPKGEPLGQPLVHATSVQAVAVSPDSQFVATSQRGGLVRVWRLPNNSPGSFRAAIDGHGTRIKVSPDGRYFLPTSLTFWVRGIRSTQVWDFASGKPAGPKLGDSDYVWDGAFSPDGRRVVLIRGVVNEGMDSLKKQKVEIWDWKSGERLFPPLSLPFFPRSVEYSPDGRRIVVLLADGQVLMIDAANGTTIDRQWQALPFSKTANLGQWYVNNGYARYSPDGKSILAGFVSPQIVVFDAETATVRYRGLEHPKGSDGFTFAPDGKVVATVGRDNVVRIWNFESGKEISSPLAHPDWVFQARFSPDGESLLTSCRDGTARLWAWRSGRLLVPGLEHTDEVLSAEFLPGAKEIVTASMDGTARVWEARTGLPMTPSLVLSGQALSVGVSSDGRFAAVGGFMNAVEVIGLGDISWRCSLNGTDFCLWAELLSGRRIVEGSGVVNLSVDEWLERWRSFRRRHPDFNLVEPTSPGRRGFEP